MLDLDATIYARNHILRDCLKSIDYEPNVRYIEPIMVLERKLPVLASAR
jgi:hypothetical protein